MKCVRTEIVRCENLAAVVRPRTVAAFFLDAGKRKIFNDFQFKFDESTTVYLQKRYSVD